MHLREKDMDVLALFRWVRWLGPASRQPRLVRRVVIHCPHTGRPVEVDLLLSETGVPESVLRCAGQSSCPPSCDHRCRESAEAVSGLTEVLIVLPPGGRSTEELD
jgi:hypothetical protein